MLIPMNERLIIEPIVETVTASGIIIPDNGKDRPYIGKILHSGNVNYIKGDMVVFNKHTALEFPKYPNILIIKEEDVYFIDK